MFAKPEIGISLSPGWVTAAIRRALGHGKWHDSLVRTELPPGSIDPVSGRIVREQVVRSAVQQILTSPSTHKVIAPLRHIQRGVGSVALAIPSSAAYIHVWSDSGMPKKYAPAELQRRIGKVLPGRGKDLVFDTHSVWYPETGTSDTMLVATDREVVQSYIALLGLAQNALAHITTAEIARYNVCSARTPGMEGSLALVVAIQDQHIEVSVWRKGIRYKSQRVPLVLEPQTVLSQRDDHSDRSPNSVAIYRVLSPLLGTLSPVEQAACLIFACCSCVAEDCCVALAEQYGTVRVACYLESNGARMHTHRNAGSGASCCSCSDLSAAVGALALTQKRARRVGSSAELVAAFSRKLTEQMLQDHDQVEGF